MTTLDNQIIHPLINAGLSEKEALIYLTLLENGASSVWEIAQKSGLKRPTCYVVLQELIIRGFASSTNDGKRTIYSVISPKQLIQITERRQNRLISVFNQLQAIANKSIEKPRIRIYEGREGMIEASNLALLEPKGSEILIYGIHSIHLFYPEFIEEFTKTRMKRKISMRLLYRNDNIHKQILKRNNKKELRTIRFLPKDKFRLSTQLYVLSDTLIHIVPSKKQPFATVIESEKLTQDERQRFELLWGMAKEIKK